VTTDPLDHVTRLLRDAVADAGDVDALPPSRDAAVSRIKDALRARATARRRRRVVTLLAVAAAVAAVVGGSVLAARRTDRSDSSVAAVATGHDLGRVVVATEGVTALRAGRTQSLGQDARLAEGTELRTAGTSEAHLDFDSGTRVTLGGGGRVRLVEQSQSKRFALEAGSFFAKVSKLAVDERFVVATPDAEVEVRGTEFRVTIVAGDAACAGGSPTRLEVSEGVVVVRHAGSEVRVVGGERWPTCAPPFAPKQVGVVATTSGSTAAPTERIAMTPRRVLSTPPASASRSPEASSRLAEQNDLFDEAMRLRRSGDLVGAEARLDRLLASYPTGPLAESAAVERMRLLAASSRARGAGAARDYLRHHPEGFARAEAEAMAAGTQ
jgi:hypothetical protein